MVGSARRPSQRWPRIQACARPTRQVGTRFRAPSNAAKITQPNPRIPNKRPTTLPPRGPCAEPEDSKQETNNASAAWPLRCVERIAEIHDRRGGKHDERRDGPGAVCSVNSHFAPLPPSISAKNDFGSTRCAASCGQAYTQLGSFKCVQRSQEVAFCLMTAFLRPGFCGSSERTSKGCRLILP